MMRLPYQPLMLCLLLMAISCQPQKETGSDPVILIKSGTVYDGESINGRPLNVRITGDRISYLGQEVPEIRDSAIVIDATGLIVAPGFIDPHTHALEDLDAEASSHNLPFLHQGITTVVTGSDGRSPVPITSSFDLWKKHGIGTNALMLVGHGQVRLEIIGDDDRAPTPGELVEMKQLVRTAMEDGAYGISTGLYYAPGFFAETDEIIELSKVVAEYGGIYDTHQRDESSYSIGLLASVEEVIQIGQQAQLPVHISHIKALGADVWGKSTEVISMITTARKAGIEVTANQYPYTASGTGMVAAALPRRVQAGGEQEMMKRINDPDLLPAIKREMAENIRRRGGAGTLLLTNPAKSEWKGKTLADLATQWQIPEVDAALKIIRDGGSGIASFNMQADDVVNFMKESWVVTGSDGSINHPRKYGTYPRKLRKYVFEDSVLSPGQAIIQSSGKVAEIFRIKDRGKIKTGYFADIVIFDPLTISDKAWFDQPEELSVGIEYVIINGQLTIQKGNWLGNKAGRVLRKQIGPS